MNLQSLAFRFAGLVVLLKSKQLSYLLEREVERERERERERKREREREKEREREREIEREREKLCGRCR